MSALIKTINTAAFVLRDTLGFTVKKNLILVRIILVSKAHVVRQTIVSNVRALKGIQDTYATPV